MDEHDAHNVHDEGHTGHQHGYHGDKDLVTARLKRIEGQIRGIQGMVENDRYCVDVLTQVNAAKAAIDAVAMLLLEDHIEGCVADALRTGEGKEKIRELTQAVQRMVRS